MGAREGAIKVRVVGDVDGDADGDEEGCGERRVVGTLEGCEFEIALGCADGDVEG